MDDKLTISQGLRKIKKLKGQIAEYQTRAQAAVTHRIDVQPAFSFSACVEKAEDLTILLLDLKGRLAYTNATTTIEFEKRTITLSAATQILQELKGQIAWYRGLHVRAQEETQEEEHTYNDEGKPVRVTTKYRCDLPEAKRAYVVDLMQDKFDRLNDLVEKTNHSVVLAP